MRTPTPLRGGLVLAAMLTLLAACDRAPDAPPPSTSAPSASGGATTSTTPANIGQPGSVEEKKEGANPVQGQVDPKEGEQRQDFKQPGDAAGPKSAETAPKQ